MTPKARMYLLRAAGWLWMLADDDPPWRNPKYVRDDLREALGEIDPHSVTYQVVADIERRLLADENYVDLAVDVVHVAMRDVWAERGRGGP